MTHEKRKLYHIKEMRRQGLTYEQRAVKIAEFKRLGIKSAIKQPQRPAAVRPAGKSLWRRIADFFKSLFYGYKKQRA